MTSADLSQLVAYCDNCLEHTPHRFSLCRDAIDSEPYTDVQCDRCHFISMCCQGWVGFVRREAA